MFFPENFRFVFVLIYRACTCRNKINNITPICYIIGPFKGFKFQIKHKFECLMSEFLFPNFQFVFVLKKTLDVQLVYVAYMQGLLLSK